MFRKVIRKNKQCMLEFDAENTNNAGEKERRTRHNIIDSYIILGRLALSVAS